MTPNGTIKEAFCFKYSLKKTGVFIYSSKVKCRWGWVTGERLCLKISPLGGTYPQGISWHAIVHTVCTKQPTPDSLWPHVNTSDQTSDFYMLYFHWSFKTWGKNNSTQQLSIALNISVSLFFLIYNSLLAVALQYVGLWILFICAARKYICKEVRTGSCHGSLHAVMMNPIGSAAKKTNQTN